MCVSWTKSGRQQQTFDSCAQTSTSTFAAAAVSSIENVVTLSSITARFSLSLCVSKFIFHSVVDSRARFVCDFVFTVLKVFNVSNVSNTNNMCLCVEQVNFGLVSIATSESAHVKSARGRTRHSATTLWRLRTNCSSR